MLATSSCEEIPLPLLERPSRADSSRVTSRLRSVLLPAAVVLVLGGWLLASPPGSSPDDVYHLGSIWCAHGYEDGRCVPTGTGVESPFALVPSPIAQLNCYAYDLGSRSAACLDDILPGRPDILARVETNVTRDRANLYYATMYFLISDDVGATVARIRIANAATALLLVTLTALVAAPGVRVALLTTWLVASLPLGLFMVTSTNTTAWGIVGLGTVWANALTAMHPGDRGRRTAAVGLLVIGATMALGARTEALPHLVAVLSAITAMVLIDRLGGSRRASSSTLRGRAGLGIAIPLIIVAAGVVAWRFAATGMFTGLFGEFRDGWDRLVARDIGNPFFTLVMEIPSFWVGVLGSWNLGWLDTRLPPSTTVPTVLVYAALLTLGLQGASRARMVAAGLTGVAMVALPLIALIPIARVVNEEMQARHFIALVYVLLGIALVRSPFEQPFTIGRGMHWTMTFGLAVAHSSALWMNIGRYTTGFTENLFIRVGREPEWWWATGPSPFTVWSVGSIAFLVATYLVLGLLRLGRDQSR